MLRGNTRCQRHVVEAHVPTEGAQDVLRSSLAHLILEGWFENFPFNSTKELGGGKKKKTLILKIHDSSGQ